MQLGDTVRITKPDGAEHLFDIKTKDDLAYYERFPIGDFTIDILKVFVDPFKDEKPILRIHQTNQEECVACGS